MRSTRNAVLVATLVALVGAPAASAQQRQDIVYGFLHVNATCSEGQPYASRAKLVSEVFAYCPPAVTRERIVEMYGAEIENAARSACGSFYAVTNRFVDGEYAAEAQANEQRERALTNPAFTIHRSFTIAPSWYCPVWRR